MDPKDEPQRRGTYGIDAPYLLPLPLLAIAWNVWEGIIGKKILPFVAAILLAICMSLGFYASRRGKFVVWRELLESLGFKGNERILDIGCGRGAVLLLAAGRLTTGCAVGVDLWNRSDQSGNAVTATQENAAKEGVANRVELHTADMTALPFEDTSFDLVLSNLAIHNVRREAQTKAIAEAVRVLRPGGRLMIADIRATNHYMARLEALGMLNVSRRNLGWRMWWSGPWAPTYLVTASKPPRVTSTMI